MAIAQSLADPVALPCGVAVPNRIVKAALTEGLSGGDNRANARFERLYRRWGEGGVGMMITGNVLVDRWHLERGGNLAISGQQDQAARAGLSAVAAAGKAHGALIVMQLNHAGRQTQKMINPRPKGPSDIGLKMGNGRFARPTPMAEAEIEAVIEAFAHAAAIADETGFDGVQIHAGHGYLVSQFLSPLSNRRTDKWGGTLDNRARLLLEIVRRIRARLRSTFIVSVKLNSADFQRGGFSEDDSATVSGWLANEGVDFIEVSGGNYEQPRMIDFNRKDPLAANKRESTLRREAYFLDFVPMLRSKVSIPVMVTGGFRTASAMLAAVRDDHVDLIGLGRPLAIDPDAPRKLIAGEVETLFSRDADLVIGNGLLGPRSPIGFLRDLNAWGSLGWYYEHIYSLADGRAPDLALSPFRALLSYDRTEARTARALVR